MELERATEIVKNNYNGEFNVTFANGLVEKKRLFISTTGSVCYKAKGKRRWGYHLPLYEVAKIEPIIKKATPPYQMFQRNVNKIVTLLSASGLWSDILETAKKMATLTEEQFKRAFELEQDYHTIPYTRDEEYFQRQDKARAEFENYFTSLGFGKIYYIALGRWLALSKKGQIVSVPYGKGNKERLVAQVNNIITNQSIDSNVVRWRGSYDYSVSIWWGEDGRMKGTFSAEYKDCGNGHYYLLLDAEHALYYEDD